MLSKNKFPFFPLPSLPSASFFLPSSPRSFYEKGKYAVTVADFPRFTALRAPNIFLLFYSLLILYLIFKWNRKPAKKYGNPPYFFWPSSLLRGIHTINWYSSSHNTYSLSTYYMPGTGLVAWHSVVHRRPVNESSVIKHRFCFPDQVEFILRPGVWRSSFSFTVRRVHWRKLFPEVPARISRDLLII